MSETPRTDRVLKNCNGWHHVPIELARELERELNVANERIKRLEEALEGTVKWIVQLADSGDAGFRDVDDQPEIIAARAALKRRTNDRFQKTN